MLKNPTAEQTTAAELEAWRRYLATIRGVATEAYEPVENAAWRRLRGELSRLGRPLPDGHTRGAT